VDTLCRGIRTGRGCARGHYRLNSTRALISHRTSSRGPTLGLNEGLGSTALVQAHDIEHSSCAFSSPVSFASSKPLLFRPPHQRPELMLVPRNVVRVFEVLLVWTVPPLAILRPPAAAFFGTVLFLWAFFDFFVRLCKPCKDSPQSNKNKLGTISRCQALLAQRRQPFHLLCIANLQPTLSPLFAC
jgi:hypothetical protein